MKYKKPEVKKCEIDVKIKTKADNQSSCAGGHCVKATYQNDPWG